jgi:hypothetical protein
VPSDSSHLRGGFQGDPAGVCPGMCPTGHRVSHVGLADEDHRAPHRGRVSALRHLEAHAHLAVHRRRGRQVLFRLRAVARSAIQLAEPKVAVGHEGGIPRVGFQPRTLRLSAEPIRCSLLPVPTNPSREIDLFQTRAPHVRFRPAGARIRRRKSSCRCACQRSSNNPHLWSLNVPHPPDRGERRTS